MIHTFSYQAQLADLSVSIACNLSSMAMSSAFAAAAVAFSLPLALVSSGRMPMAGAGALPGVTIPHDAVTPYSAYRSDGGHATTLVIMGPMPAPAR